MSGDGTVTVLFFAAMREAMGTGSLRTDLPAPGMTAQALLSHLCTDDPVRAAAVARIQVRAAINHAMAPLDTPVRAGDEVAFFPPVTGG